jgi:hypothetical protein
MPNFSSSRIAYSGSKLRAIEDALRDGDRREK